MKNIGLALIFAVSFNACASNSPKILINELLNIKNDTHYYQQAGKQFYDELAAYQALEKEYLALKDNALKSSASEKDIKYFLFLGFVIKQRNNVGLMEALNSDVMEVYLINQSSFIQILNEVPLLIGSSCYYLGRHFGFEGKNDEKFLIDFEKEFKNSVKNILSDEQLTQCLLAMKKL